MIQHTPSNFSPQQVDASFSAGASQELLAPQQQAGALTSSFFLLNSDTTVTSRILFVYFIRRKPALRFVVVQNHALDAWFGKNYIVEKDKKTSFVV